MPNQLGHLWRGETLLAKTFWLFGIFIPLTFVSLVIIIGRNLNAVTWASPNASFYVNAFILLVYLVYAVFILVAVWRSSNKYQGQRVVSLFAKLTNIVAVFWFGINLGLFFLVMTVCSPVLQTKINFVPDKLSLPKAEIQSDSFYFSGFRMNFPFYKSDIKNAWPTFYNHQLILITVFLADNLKHSIISFDITQNIMPSSEETALDKSIDWLLNKEDKSYFENLAEIHNARLIDYSAWNLRANLRLAANLTLKAIAVPQYDLVDYKVSEVDTPYLKGYLINGLTSKNRYLIHFTFLTNGRSYNISGIVSDKTVYDKLLASLGSIQPVNSSEMRRMRQHEEKSQYPKELLLLSSIANNGPTLDNLNEFLKIEEKHSNNKIVIESIKQEIDFHSK